LRKSRVSVMGWKRAILIVCDNKRCTLSETVLWPSSYSKLHGLWK
jgi:hypothetical protein